MEALQKIKEMGATSVQIYTFWKDFEPNARGEFNFEHLDRQVKLIKEAGHLSTWNGEMPSIVKDA